MEGIRFSKSVGLLSLVILLGWVVAVNADVGSAAKAAKGVMLWGPKVEATYWQVPDANAPCGTQVNGATLPPGYAHCADNFCVNLPKDVGTVTAITLMAKDSSGEKQCKNEPNTDCDIGWSRFWSSPEQHPDKICGHFKNRSNNRDRWPGFYVTYIPR
jgi:hypothetical protein